MNINWNPDWRRPENMRTNLLVTFGCRAGQMAALGDITLPSGAKGEDLLAALGRTVVNEWESRDDWDTSFDEFIETALLAHFSPEKGAVISGARRAQMCYYLWEYLCEAISDDEAVARILKSHGLTDEEIAYVQEGWY